MTDKKDFTPEEWTKVLESVMLAGMAVSAADPNHLWGMIKEAFASRSALNASQAEFGSNELVQAVIADLLTPDGRNAVQQALRKRVAGAGANELIQRSLTTLREVSVIVDAKAPGDAAAFKACLRRISQKVAEASQEGGFLGFGGVKVSDAERATLDDISKSLGTST
jgi:hypothetical protein